MRYESIADIYSINAKTRDRFLTVIQSVTDDEVIVLPDGEPWSIGYIVEHVAIVNGGMAGICGKLIEKAKSNGTEAGDGLAISDKFYECIGMMATRKAEAPERVRPSGSLSVAESKDQLAAGSVAFESFRKGFEQLDLTEPTFPHPYFGDLTAVEWFALAGIHERRHTDQIERLLTKIRQ